MAKNASFLHNFEVQGQVIYNIKIDLVWSVLLWIMFGQWKWLYMPHYIAGWGIIIFIWEIFIDYIMFKAVQKHPEFKHMVMENVNRHQQTFIKKHLIRSNMNHKQQK